MRFLFMLLLFLCSCASDYGFEERTMPVISPGDDVDILLVIDTSCSMRSEIGVISFELARAVESLDEIDVDWQIAATSAELTSDTWAVVPNSHPDPGRAILEEVTKFASTWTLDEAGFGATLHRMEIHPDFFRQSAILLVVFVSDEEEQSQLTVDFFSSKLDAFRYNAVISIVGSGSNDTGIALVPDCYADLGQKYIDASDIHIDVCSWGPWRLFEDLLK